jgi:hypothetical protein
MARAPRKLPQPGPWYLRFGNVSQIASAVVALIGFSAVVWQINIARDRYAHEELRSQLYEARRVYMSYSETTLTYPQFTEPSYDALMRNHAEYLRYQNFFSHMLYAYDEVIGALRAMGDQQAEREWALALQLDLEPHQRFICHMPDPRLVETFRPFMRDYIASVRKDCQSFQPLVEQKPQ